MLFARLVLLVQALVWGALGVLYWVRPYEMANLSGMLLMEPSAVSDARVFYGGHQFALALFLLFALRRASLVQPALILVVLLQSILTLSRLLIAWIEGGMEAGCNGGRPGCRHPARAPSVARTTSTACDIQG